MMRLARRSIWTRAKHRVGLERPHFLPLARGQKTTGVAPAHPIEPAFAGTEPQTKTVYPLACHASRIGEIAHFLARTARRRFVQSIRKPASLSDTASDNL
jgi:hypothetical protein